MEHILVRRLAILLAAVSFGALMVTVLVYSAGVGLPVVAEAYVQPIMAQKQEKVKSLPMQVEGTVLIAKNLAVYDGAFYEDGSGREVLGVAALVVQNSGGQMLWQCRVEMQIEGQRYVFEGMLVPPYATVLIPEKTAKQYVKGKIGCCQGTAVVAPEPSNLPLCINGAEMGSLVVQNISDEVISGAVMYHKTYLGDVGMYIGGRAFETALTQLGPGEKRTVTPANYAAGYSQLLCVYSWEKQ